MNSVLSAHSPPSGPLIQASPGVLEQINTERETVLAQLIPHVGAVLHGACANLPSRAVPSRCPQGSSPPGPFFLPKPGAHLLVLRILPG